MKVTHPNKSVETWCEYPKMMLHVQAPNPFGGMWGMNIDHGIHNQCTGNPSTPGIWGRKRKWYLDFQPGVG